MNRAVTLLMLVLLLLTPLPLLAEEKVEKEKEMSIAFAPFTYHWDSRNSNSFNRLLAFSYDDWCVGWFNNSHYNETVFAGYAFRTKRYEIDKTGEWFVRGNVYLGIVYGYGDDLPTNVGGFSPYGLPTAEIGRGKFSFELGTIPVPGPAGFVTGMFKYTF